MFKHVEDNLERRLGDFHMRVQVPRSLIGRKYIWLEPLRRYPENKVFGLGTSAAGVSFM